MLPASLHFQEFFQMAEQQSSKATILDFISNMCGLTRGQMGAVDRPKDPDINEKIPPEYEMRKRFVAEQPEGWQPHLGLNVSAAG